jgi:hypothetical protein
VNFDFCLVREIEKEGKARETKYRTLGHMCMRARTVRSAARPTSTGMLRARLEHVWFEMYKRFLWFC